MNPQPSLDPIAVAGLIFATWAAPTVAHVLGAYFVIILAASAGSGWALMRREKKGTLNAMGFVSLMTLTSSLTTVGVSELVQHYVQVTTPSVLLVPISLMIGGIGHDWPKVVPWLANTVVNIITRGGNAQKPVPTPDKTTGATPDE